MAISGRKEEHLDGEEIMDLWIKLGSLKAVSQFYVAQGKVNPSNGQYFAENSFWRACGRWLVEEPAKAREKYAAYNSFFTDEEWDLYVLRRAFQMFSNSRTGFLRWVIHQKWPMKYEAYYKDKFNVRPEDYDYFANTQRTMPSGEGRKNDAPLGRPRNINKPPKKGRGRPKKDSNSELVQE
jgi:hypothetical protein